MTANCRKDLRGTGEVLFLRNKFLPKLSIDFGKYKLAYWYCWDIISFRILAGCPLIFKLKFQYIQVHFQVYVPIFKYMFRFSSICDLKNPSSILKYKISHIASNGCSSIITYNAIYRFVVKANGNNKEYRKIFENNRE